MFDDNHFTPRIITCLIHRKQKATHICTQLSCQQNSFLCNFCFNQIKWRSQHPHQSSIKPINQGIQSLTTIIRNQSKTIELLYQRTIGNRQSQQIKINLEKGSLLYQQLQNRLQNLKIQLQLELELLIKEFQRQIQFQKQQFMRKIEDYKRIFGLNSQNIRKECIQIINFQQSLKYYNNCNNFTLKLINQTQKKSQQWFLYQKKILGRTSQVLQNPVFSTNLSILLNKANKMNIFNFPNWRGQKKDGQIQKLFHSLIKNSISGWIDIPEMTDSQLIKPIEYTGSNKFLAYPIVT